MSEHTPYREQMPCESDEKYAEYKQAHDNLFNGLEDRLNKALAGFDAEENHKIIYTHCCRCGRKLRTAEAQELGFGPVCYKKMKNSIKRVNTDGKTIKMRRLFEIAKSNTRIP